MEGFRRTIPRSARRAPPRQETPLPSTTPQTPLQSTHDVTPERYLPGFHGSTTKTTKAEPQALPPIRTGVEVLTPPTTTPVFAFASAPLTAVRWLPVPGRAAVAAVGSGDGEPGADYLTLYAVSAEKIGLHAESVRELPHAGKVLRLAVSAADSVLYAASSDGTVRMLGAARWDDEAETMEDLTRLPKRGARREAVVGLAPLSGGRVAAVGSEGTLAVADAEARQLVFSLAQCDGVGFTDAAAVDPDSGHEVVTAASSGEVAVWDTRAAQATNSCASLLHHPVRGMVTSCVTADAVQGNFVIAGTRTGEVCIWDRRGTTEYPLNRVAMHDGIVWETRVVSSSKPGLLLSCGEDTRVWLMDFAAGAGRAGMGAVSGSWCDSGEFWRASISQSDVRDVGREAALGVNGVDAHTTADLYAYTSDSGSVGFGSLYS